MPLLLQGTQKAAKKKVPKGERKPRARSAYLYFAEAKRAEIKGKLQRLIGMGRCMLEEIGCYGWQLYLRKGLHTSVEAVLSQAPNSCSDAYFGVGGIGRGVHLLWCRLAATLNCPLNAHVTAAQGENQSMGEVSKAVGMLWKATSAEDRVCFEVILDLGYC